MTPTTFTTICKNTKNFPKVTITVTKTKVLETPAWAGIQTKIGGICPLCNQMHTAVITDNSDNKYAPIYPVKPTRICCTNRRRIDRPAAQGRALK